MPQLPSGDKYVCTVLYGSIAGDGSRNPIIFKLYK
jgi:hypothetical protein